MTEIEIDLDDPEALKLWSAVGELVEQLPGEWVLIGGLMVQLHALEHGVLDVRATADIDVLAQARPQGALRMIDESLRREGSRWWGRSTATRIDTSAMDSSLMCWRLMASGRRRASGPASKRSVCRVARKPSAGQRPSR
jgi:hypothetical protein